MPVSLGNRVNSAHREPSESASTRHSTPRFTARSSASITGAVVASSAMM
jgi:hypothetical protein